MVAKIITTITMIRAEPDRKPPGEEPFDGEWIAHLLHERSVLILVAVRT